jgi:hypothetical protein
MQTQLQLQASSGIAEIKLMVHQESETRRIEHNQNFAQMNDLQHGQQLLDNKVGVFTENLRSGQKEVREKLTEAGKSSVYSSFTEV